MKKKLLAVAFAASALSMGTAGAVSADEGGVPNESATGELDTGTNGRKGDCIPPGYTFKQAAKLDGANNVVAGQVPLQCTQD